MHTEKTIFAIDNNNDIHTVAKFMRHLDTARAMGDLQGNITLCVGYWEGILEQSFLMDSVDYARFVLGFGFTKEQECILRVSGDTRQPCTLETFDGKHIASVGVMCEVSAEGAKELDAWTFVPATNKYFATKG